MLDIHRNEDGVPCRQLMTDAVELRDDASARDVDELLGEGVVVLGDPVAGTDRRNTHVRPRATHALRAQQCPDVAAAAVVRRNVVDRPDGRLIVLWHSLSFPGPDLASKEDADPSPRYSQDRGLRRCVSPRPWDTRPR